VGAWAGWVGCTTSETNDGPNNGGSSTSSSSSGGSSSGGVDSGLTEAGVDAGGGPILRTLVYHQITNGENDGVDTSKSFQVSRDGTVALFDENISGKYVPTTVHFDGTGKKGFGPVTAGNIDMTALSGDGSFAAWAANDVFTFGTVATSAVATGPAAISFGWAAWRRIRSRPRSGASSSSSIACGRAARRSRASGRSPPTAPI